MIHPSLAHPAGARLRRARVAARLDVFAAALALGLSWEELWHLEEGRTPPDVSPGLLERAARVYGVTLYWLELGAAKGGAP